MIPAYFTQSEAGLFGAEFPERMPISKLLSECTAEDMTLMSLLDECCEIYLTDGPYPINTYHFTMIITTDDGTVHKIPVKYV